MSVETNTPPLPTQAVNSQPEPADGAISAPPGEDSEADGRSWRGIRVIDQPQGEVPSLLVEIRTAELPRWKPRMDFDQPRDLTDDG